MNATDTTFNKLADHKTSVQSLIDLYNAQSIFVDSLPGTLEFLELCNRYRAKSENYRVSNDIIYRMLMVLRKQGRLASKRVRRTHPAYEPTWPLTPTDNAFHIQLDVTVTKDDIGECCEIHFEKTGQLPVSRKETFGIVQKYFQHKRYNTIAVDVITRINKLFPELMWISGYDDDN